jgi:hypothetical protein
VQQWHLERTSLRRATARRHGRAHPRVITVCRRTMVDRRGLRVSVVCVSPARTSRTPPRPVSSRATRRARAHRGAIGSTAAHARHGHHNRALKRRTSSASKRGSSAHVGYKRAPLSSLVHGHRRHRSAIAAASVSFPLRSLPPPVKASTLFPRPPGSSHGHLLNFPTSSLTGNRAPAGAPPQHRRCRSPEPPPATQLCVGVRFYPNRSSRFFGSYEISVPKF